MSLSETAKREAFAQETEEVFLVLLTIEHPDLAAPIRVVNNTEDVVSNGYTFIGYPFEVELPGHQPNRPPRARLKIDNVDDEDRSMMTAIRSITSPPTVRFDIVLASNPNVIEKSFTDMILEQVDYDAHEITGELVYEPVLVEPFPGDTFTPARFPGLF